MFFIKCSIVLMHNHLLVYIFNSFTGQIYPLIQPLKRKHRKYQLIITLLTFDKHLINGCFMSHLLVQFIP